MYDIVKKVLQKESVEAKTIPLAYFVLNVIAEAVSR